MLRFINGLQVDRFGTSVPGAYPLTAEQQAGIQLAEIKAQKLGSIAASAADRLGQDPTNIGELDRLCASGGFTIAQRMHIKREVLERGRSLADALKTLR
jgi:hypothetical protein